jgi:hypothetical protein
LVEGLLSVLLAMAIGVPLGIFSGFVGGKTDCQAKIEMSYSYQSRNVLFSRLRFNRSSSFVTVLAKLEVSPGVVCWRRGRFDLSWDSQGLLFS